MKFESSAIRFRIFQICLARSFSRNHFPRHFSLRREFSSRSRSANCRLHTIAELLIFFFFFVFHFHSIPSLPFPSLRPLFVPFHFSGHPHPFRKSSSSMNSFDDPVGEESTDLLILQAEHWSSQQDRPLLYRHDKNSR